MDIRESLQWRYATKRFNADKKLSSEQLEMLLDAVNLAPTSYGLQPFEVVLVEDAALRAKLKEAAYGQPQLTEASHILVFAANKDLSEEHIDAYVERTADQRGVSVDDLKDFRAAMVGAILSNDAEGRFQWAARQAYISLGVLLSSAAVAGIDACPMEGFDKAGFDEILGLSERGLSSVMMAALGFRSPEDKYAGLPKVRKSKDELIERRS